MDAPKPKLPLIDQREIEARIVGPLIRAFATEIGEARTLAIVRDLIHELARNAGSELARAVGEQTIEAFAEGLDRWKENGALEIDVLEKSPERLSFNVTRCRYAEMYHALGLADLGGTLSCQRDYALIQGFNPDIELTRTQTIMEGLTATSASAFATLTPLAPTSGSVRIFIGGGPGLCRHIRSDRKTAWPPENLRPEMLLLIGKDRDRFPRDLDVFLVRPRALSDASFHPIAIHLRHMVPLLVRQSQEVDDDRPVEQRKDSLPLEVDLAQPLALLSRQMLAQPLALRFVNGPPCRDHSGAGLALQAEPCRTALRQSDSLRQSASARARDPSGRRSESREIPVACAFPTGHPAARRRTRFPSSPERVSSPAVPGGTQASVVPHASFHPPRNRRALAISPAAAKRNPRTITRLRCVALDPPVVRCSRHTPCAVRRSAGWVARGTGSATGQSVMPGRITVPEWRKAIHGDARRNLYVQCEVVGRPDTPQRKRPFQGCRPGRAVLCWVVGYNAGPTKTPLPHSLVVPARLAETFSSWRCCGRLGRSRWLRRRRRCGTRFLCIVVGIRFRNGLAFRGGAVLCHAARSTAKSTKGPTTTHDGSVKRRTDHVLERRSLPWIHRLGDHRVRIVLQGFLHRLLLFPFGLDLRDFIHLLHFVPHFLEGGRIELLLIALIPVPASAVIAGVPVVVVPPVAAVKVESDKIGIGLLHHGVHRIAVRLAHVPLDLPLPVAHLVSCATCSSVRFSFSIMSSRKTIHGPAGSS